MEKLLDTYLEKYNLKRYQVAKQTGIGTTTLQRSSDKVAFAINPRVYASVAEILHKTPGQVFDEIIRLEEDTDMTTEELKVLLSKVFADMHTDTYVYTEDMGDFVSVVAEITLPSDETVRFAVNMLPDQDITRDDVFSDLSDAMTDLPTDEDSVVEIQDAASRLVVPESIAVSEEDSQFLNELSGKLNVLRKQAAK